MSIPTLGQGGLESILGGMDRGGMAIRHEHGDNQPGLGYVAPFDASQLGRSGNTILNRVCHNGHYDIIERTSGGDFLHHRIYDPNR